MLFMDDAIKATINLMQADPKHLTIWSSYNLAAISFTPKQIFESIKKHIPEFSITYSPDFRQAIADSWPSSIDDKQARNDWGWQHDFDLENTTAVMLKELHKKYK
jgi:nucleoside-diphosphate-sugar epimerase